MKKVSVASLALFSLVCLHAVAQEKVVRLYEDSAPGSEDWKRTEQESRTNLWRTRVVFNVVNPTLTVFQPEASKANGTAVIICPGGAFFGLSIDSEGFDVARWLNEKGVTCFVLKYRLVQCKTDDPTTELMTRGPLDEVVAPVVKLALADGLAAIGHVRKNAKDYGVNPDRIGVIGFSAGGTVTASVAYNYTPELARISSRRFIWPTTGPSSRKAFPRTPHRCSSWLRPTILWASPRRVSPSIKIGLLPENLPSCTCIPRAVTASA